jgi:hypothetical protein
MVELSLPKQILQFQTGSYDSKAELTKPNDDIEIRDASL